MNLSRVLINTYQLVHTWVVGPNLYLVLGIENSGGTRDRPDVGRGRGISISD